MPFSDDNSGSIEQIYFSIVSLWQVDMMVSLSICSPRSQPLSPILIHPRILTAKRVKAKKEHSLYIHYLSNSVEDCEIATIIMR